LEKKGEEKEELTQFRIVDPQARRPTNPIPR
jgi:hypothetical protein